MDKHIFTFGQHHEYCDRHQIIFANEPEKAEDKMFEVYGRNWAFQYTEKQWEKSKSEGFFLKSEPLEPIYCGKMDFEEFVDHLKERGEYNCYCNATEYPPCGFCEGGVNDLYEKYLNEEEEQ